MDVASFSDKVKAGIYEDFEIDFSGINIEQAVRVFANKTMR